VLTYCSGKALCFLSKNDLAERCAGAGDVIHNILQMLLREASSSLPSSPLTPRPPGLITPTSPSPFGSHWPLLNSSASETFPNLSHLISQTNSVTLSPAPSLDSTSGGSPKGAGNNTTTTTTSSSSAQAAAAAAAAALTSLPPLYLPPHLHHMPPQRGDQRLPGVPARHPSNGGGSSNNSDSEDSMTESQRSPRTPATPNSLAAPKSPSSAPSSSCKGILNFFFN
jgi:hypothetical protein